MTFVKALGWGLLLAMLLVYLPLTVLVVPMWNSDEELKSLIAKIAQVLFFIVWVGGTWRHYNNIGKSR